MVVSDNQLIFLTKSELLRFSNLSLFHYQFRLIAVLVFVYGVFAQVGERFVWFQTARRAWLPLICTAGSVHTLSHQPSQSLSVQYKSVIVGQRLNIDIMLNKKMHTKLTM